MAGRKEIYTYKAPWAMFGLSFSARRQYPFRLAISSFLEEYDNKVQVIQLNENSGEFEVRVAFTHPYPPTKIMWIPDKEGSQPDYLATAGDYLRLWRINDNASLAESFRLDNNKTAEYCAPLTSFDWNETDPNMLVTSSIDTTCTVWDLATRKVKTQLIAHDKEVFDVGFQPNSLHEFASVGADGSLRFFDLRQLDHSTIMYESSAEKGQAALLRVAWNKQDPHYLATMALESNRVVVLDTRRPSVPVAELDGHSKSVNTIAWAPHSSTHICTGGNDSQALIWNLTTLSKKIEPFLCYNAEAEINQLQWSSAQPEWIAIAFANKMQILRV